MKKVLLVEDDAFIRDLASAKLVQSGFDIEIAESGATALHYLDQFKVDIIILDLELPDMHGTALLKKLHEIPFAEQPPVIIFSNNDTPEIIEKCKKLGAKAFFVKINTELTTLVTEINKQLS